MKGVAGVVALALALAVGTAGIASASGPTGPVAVKAKPKAKTKTKKKCKRGKVFRKGKCRAPKIRALPPPSPRSLVRGRLSWDGPASLALVVTDAQGRQANDFANEIPDTDFRVEGGPGHYTEIFTDHVFYGDYNVTYHPSPGNRQFSYTTCYYGSPTSEPTHVDFMWVAASGLTSHRTWTITPPPGPEVTGCATWIN
jgi:hypothetical protein